MHNLYCGIVKNRARAKNSLDHPKFQFLPELLDSLKADKNEKAVIQPLYFLPGTEFHELRQLCQQSGINYSLGMPLLSSPVDFYQLGNILHPIFTKKAKKAMVLLGHGTVHPVWTAYVALETLLRQRFGERIFVGVLDKYPNSETLPERIASAGFTESCIIPLLFTPGMHLRRDILGNSPHSWSSRLQQQGLSVETIEDGLGMFPGIEMLFIQHITTALHSFGL
jgi:sirohydrochlorin cobaltochelatase